MVGMLGAALPVAAYDPSGYASRDYQYANDLLNSFQNRFQYDLVDPVRKRVYREQRARTASATKQRSAAPAAAATTFRPTGAAGGGVDKLVSAYPASMQGQVRTEFRKLLAELGTLMVVEMSVFLAILLLALCYAWRKGALEWT